MQTVTQQVNDEVKALGDALAALASGIKTKQPVMDIVSKVLPLLLPAAAGFQSLGTDLQAVDNQIYLVYALAKALEG